MRYEVFIYETYQDLFKYYNLQWLNTIRENLIRSIEFIRICMGYKNLHNM
jgi:hypothetical protein